MLSVAAAPDPAPIQASCNDGVTAIASLIADATAPEGRGRGASHSDSQHSAWRNGGEPYSARTSAGRYSRRRSEPSGDGRIVPDTEEVPQSGGVGPRLTAATEVRERGRGALLGPDFRVAPLLRLLPLEQRRDRSGRAECIGRRKHGGFDSWVRPAATPIPSPIGNHASRKLGEGFLSDVL